MTIGCIRVFRESKNGDFGRNDNWVRKCFSRKQERGCYEANPIELNRPKAEGTGALLKTYRYTGSNSRCQSPRVEIACIRLRQPKN